MAVAAAAAGPGVPLSPDELLPKGDAEKPEEELEEEDDEEVLGAAGRAGRVRAGSGGEGPACCRSGTKARRGAWRGPSRGVSGRRGEAPLGPGCPSSRGPACPGVGGWLPLLRPISAPPPPQLDETLSERLWGLTEMFPERVRSAAGATFDLSLFVAQKMYR